MSLIQREWGRGEGSDLGFRGAKRVKMSGDSLPEAQGGGEQHARLHQYGFGNIFGTQPISCAS